MPVQVGAIALSGDDDYRNEPRRRLLFQLPTDLEPVAFGLDQIDEHDVGRIRRAGVECRVLALHDEHLVTLMCEKAPEESPAALIAVGDQDRRSGHPWMSCKTNA